MKAPDAIICAAAPLEVDLGGQTRPAEYVVRYGAHRGAVSAALMDAMDTGAEWIWLLGPGIVPLPGTLANLLVPLREDTPIARAAILASKIVGGNGALDLTAPPWPRMLARELSLLGAEHRVMALRAARYGSILVNRTAVDQHGAPRTDFADAADDLEWTGRVLRDDPGFLVPHSIAVRSHPLAILLLPLS